MADAPVGRSYRKQKRAVQEEETRRRITEAVVELHRTVGPANTKVTDVADLAGVSRMTVYNQFPTEAALIEACSAHWAARNPTPDLSRWSDIDDPRERLVEALTELYSWYAQTEDMMGNVLRDAPLVPPLADIMEARWWSFVDEAVRVLATGWTVRGGKRADVLTALRLVVDFSTWELLRENAANDSAAARVAARMVAGVLRSP